MRTTIIGVVRQKQEILTFPDTDFTKQILIVESLETRTPYRVDFSNDRIKLIDDILLGQNVKIEVTIRGNYDKIDNKTVYNSIEANSISLI